MATRILSAMSPTFLQLTMRAALVGMRRRDPSTALRLLFSMQDRLVATVNELAIEYDGGVHAKHRLMRYHDFFVDRIAPDERVLDVGCGYGAVAYSIASRSRARVVGLDISEANVRKAKELFQHPNLSFVKGDARTDLPSGPFDTVVLSNVLEHIDERVLFLGTIQRRIGPRKWLLRVPMLNRSWEIPLRKELGIRYFSDPTHFTEYTDESFRTEISDAGLRIDSLKVIWGEIWAEASR